MSIFLDKKLSGLIPYTPGEQPKTDGRLIKLNTNESPFPPSERVSEALVANAGKDLRLYSDPHCSRLVAAIAATHGVDEGQVCVGNGSDELLAFAFHGLCPSGAAFPDLTYGFYRVFCDMFGVKQTVVPLKENFSIDPADYKTLDETLFIANPNAPTGLFLPLAGIEILLRQNPSRLVVVDEAYIDFGGESALALLPNYENLLVIRTFSKSRSLAGGRVGYAIGSHDLIADLNRMRFSFNPYNVNTLSLIAAEQAVLDVDYFDSCREKIIENREKLQKGLAELGFSLTDSRANFVFAGEHPALSAVEYDRELRKRGILVRYFPQKRIDNYVRITVGTGEEVELLLTATKEIIKESRR